MRLEPFLVVLALAAGPAGADTVSEAVAACDRFAASPEDPTRPGPGVADRDVVVAKAVAACRKAVSEAPESARMRFQLGRVFELQERYEAARRAYLAAHDMGYPIATRALGRLYDYGLGVDTEFDKAAAFYRQALDAGFAPAATDLGLLHQRGEGFEKDPVEAARLYRIAAEAGDPSGQIQLGYLYENGIGLEKDEAAAVRWYRAAADQGDPLGQFNLALMYSYGTGVDQDEAEAVRLLRLAAEQDYGSAILELARYSQDGVGMPADKAESERLYRLAIGSDDSDVVWQAQNELAWMFAVDNRNLGEAAALAARALDGVDDDDENRGSVRDTAGWIAHLQGDNDRAVVLLSEAVRLDVQYAPYHDRLGDVLAALGRPADAAAEWRTALELEPADGDALFHRDAIAAKLAKAAPPQAAPSRESTAPTVSPIR